MKKTTGISLSAILLISVCIALPIAGQEKKGAEETYTIKQGDTLWDISAQFLKDPFLWPKLWHRNPYITNPHLIYPGKPIRLTPFEEAKEPLREVTEERPKEMVKEPEIRKAEVSPSPAVMEEKPKAVEVRQAETKPVDVKPVGWPDTRSAGFFSDVDSQGIGLVLESREGKNLMSEGDIVYLSFKTAEPVLVGNKYTVVRPTDPLVHPVTGKRMGRRYNITGNLQVIDQNGQFFAAKIIESFREIQKGDLIQPYSKAIMEGEVKKN
jgi:LysM repeat protein